ncbi:FAD-binding oxidoreductase [Candidatus Obscuribacterales bacterium]|nr:FAD-binding oxidoreductase [Candidatus Obscuribacterales bacterium]
MANTIGTTVFDGGRVQCNELEIEDSKQLCDVLRHANNERVFVFRGTVNEGPAKLAKLFPASEKHVQAVFLNLSKMNRIIEHVKGDQVISVETGILVSELNEYLSKHGQWLPVEFSSATVSLADILDTADGGYLEPFSGGVKHLVLGMELGIAHGELIKTGGKIVKNVTGYDLSKVFTGSRSWLAVPHMVHLRLHSKPETEVAFVVSSEKPHELVGLANRLQATGLPAFSLELIDKRLLQRIAILAR